MKFAIHDHAGKGAYLTQQLLAAGHERAERIDQTDVLLLDCDWPWAQPRPAMIDAAVQSGAKVALYPHGGMPTVFAYDGLAEPHADVALRLEHGPGSIDIARLFGAEHRLVQHAPGWLFSPTAPFAPRESPGRVLFAPMHPNIEAMLTGRNGYDPAPDINRAVYQQLLDGGYDLAVSLVGPPHRNGVWPHPRARFLENPSMSFQHSYQLVASADSVVAAGTMGALAVALGKPTVMLGQGDWSDYVGGRYVRASHASLYSDTARYPLDADEGDLAQLLARACRGDRAAAEWRAKFVGDDGTAAAIRLLENHAGGTLSEQAKLGGRMAKKTKNQKYDEAQADSQTKADGGNQKNVSIGGVTARAGANA